MEFDRLIGEIPDGMRVDPDIKAMQYGDKKIFLGSTAIMMITPDAIISISDEEGVSIISEKDIRVQSDKNIYLQSLEELMIVGEGGVTLKSELASVELDENILIKGREVKIN